MKLDTKAFRYLSPEDWRVLSAVEVGTKNHTVVPTPLIASLSSLRGGANGANRSISVLAKAGLIAKVKNAKYDGYRLTYGGLDYLALHAHTNSGAIVHLGSQMGTGKESDVYLVTSPEPASGRPVQTILKLHRLGRISFRSLARNRDYRGSTRQNMSWQYLSRLSAQKEFAAMKALYEAGFPVPRPIAWNRHTVVMSLVPGVPLRQVGVEAFELGAVPREDNDEGEVEGGGQSEDVERRREERDQRIADLYEACMEMALRLAEYGCIHGDFNEFNILIENVPDMDEEEKERAAGAATVDEATPLPSNASGRASQHEQYQQETRKPLIPHLIDFPQITSLNHVQAQSYFTRDIDCIKRFFAKKYSFTSSDSGPSFEDALARLNDGEKRRAGRAEIGTPEQREAAKMKRLDVQIAAMGFSKKMAKELETYFAATEGGHEEADVDTGADSEAATSTDPIAEQDDEELGVADGEREGELGTSDLDFGGPSHNGDEALENTIQMSNLELTHENLAKIDGSNASVGIGHPFKMPAISIASGRQKSLAKPKAAAGWSI